jgi:cytochrome P450
LEFETLPGPRGLPLVGNALAFDPKAVHLVLERWAAQYGRAYKMRIGRRPAIVLSDPADVHQVLRERPEAYRRETAMSEIIEEISGRGVFTAEGDQWRVQRRLTMAALGARHLRSYYPVLTTSARRLLACWRRAAASGEPQDIGDHFARFTLDVTTNLALGVDVNALENPDGAEAAHIRTIFEAFTRRLLAPLPTWRWFKMPRDRRVDRASRALRALAEQALENARVALEREPGRADAPTNLVEAMLVASRQEKAGLSAEVVMGNIVQIIAAGTDTTSNTLAFMVHLWCDDADVQQALQREADRVLDGQDLPAEPRQVDALAYTQAVADEAMRLFPPAPFVTLTTLEETVVAGVRVPAGIEVYGLLRPGCREPARFPSPEAFSPQHWRSPTAAQKQAAIPFGTGPRLCPGRSLALLEMKLATSLLARHFHVSRVGDPSAVRDVFAFTLHPTGLRVRLRERRPAPQDSC